MCKKWMFVVWVVVLLWSTAGGVLGQEAGAEEDSGAVEDAAGEEGAEGSTEETEGEPPDEGNSTDDGEAAVGALGTKEESVFAGAWRVLREQQRHLTGSQEDAGLPLAGILALFLVGYVIVVLGVLTFWRRSHTPTFRQRRAEQIGGAGRWASTIAYTLRRKVDARIELRMTRVEPEGTAAELAYLVDGQIKGRLSPGAEAHLDFPGLKPKSFWQKDQLEVIPLGFELIQPRDHAITIHIEGRVDYCIGSRKGTGGELRQVLEFTPALEGSLLGLRASGPEEAPPQAPTAEPALFGEPPVVPLAAPLSAPVAAAGPDPSSQLADRAAEAANLAAERALSTLEEFRRRRGEIDQRLAVLEAREEGPASGGEGGGRDREIKALEERLGSDLRENIQAVMEQVDDLRAEVSSLRALVSDLAQRVP